MNGTFALPRGKDLVCMDSGGSRRCDLGTGKLAEFDYVGCAGDYTSIFSMEESPENSELLPTYTVTSDFDGECNLMKDENDNKVLSCYFG